MCLPAEVLAQACARKRADRMSFPVNRTPQEGHAVSFPSVSVGCHPRLFKLNPIRGLVWSRLHVERFKSEGFRLTNVFVQMHLIRRRRMRVPFNLYARHCETRRRVRRSQSFSLVEISFVLRRRSNPLNATLLKFG